MSPAALAGALAGLLRELSRQLGSGSGRLRVVVLPARVGCPRLEEVQVVGAGGVHRIGHLKGDDLHPMVEGAPAAYLQRVAWAEVEMALREEIEARGWQWRVRARFPVGTGYWARVDTHPGQLAEYPGYEGSADSPALALSLALLVALGAPAGAGAGAGA